MPSVNTLLARRTVDQSITLLRYGASVRSNVLGLLGKMEKELVSELANTKLTVFNNKRYREMLAAVREISTSTFDAAARMTGEAVEDVMVYAVQETNSAVKTITGIDLLGRTADLDWIASVAENSLVQGATNAAWWEKQAKDLVFKFEQQVRLGMTSNETTDAIISRIRSDGETPGVLYQTRAQAAALVQTAIAEGANDARLAMYRKNEDIIRGVQQISTLDDRTTDTCIAYDQAAWDLDGEPIDGTDLPFDGGPPRHWNCRSTLVPIIKSSEELGTDVEVLEGARASMDGEVSEKMSFGDWLETKTEEQQDAILGAGKAQLWRDDKITLRDLLDQSGRPLTLEQLEERVVDYAVVKQSAEAKALAAAERAEYSRQKAAAKAAGEKFIYVEPAEIRAERNRLYGGGSAEATTSTAPAVPRVAGALSEEYTGAVSRKDFDWIARSVREYANDVEFPLENITITDVVRKVTIGEVDGFSAGFARGDQVTIIVNKVSTSFDAKRTLAHEIQHVKLNKVEDSVASYIKANFAKLEREDGVTDYSERWWANYRADPSNARYKRSAVSETLSEIAAVAEGRYGKEAAPVWQTLFNKVNSEYAKAIKP